MDAALPNSDQNPAPYCDPAPRRSDAAPADPDGGAPRAGCVLCGKPTEYPATAAGTTLCPVCEWQQDQRGACSG